MQHILASLLLPVLSGFGIAAATLLLYFGLATGPVTIVSPIAGSYPALVVGFEVVTGFRPSLPQWCAMAVTLIGVQSLFMPDMLVEIEVEALMEPERLKIPASAKRR